MPLSILVWDVALLASVTYAFVRGGRTERIAAAAFLVSAALDAVATAQAWRRFQLMPELIEGALVCVLFYLAMASDRWWSTLAIASQLIAWAARLIPTFDPRTRPYAAYFGEVFWDYLTLAALVVGTAVEGPKELLFQRSFHGHDQA